MSIYESKRPALVTVIGDSNILCVFLHSCLHSRRGNEGW